MKLYCTTLAVSIVLFVQNVWLSPLMAETLRLPVTQDNSIVLVDGEWDVNAGEQGRIRIKGNQHIVVMSFDMQPILGKVVDKATLVCVQGENLISGVTLSTIATPWHETRSSGLTSGAEGVIDWGYKGARFPAVSGGNGHTFTQDVQSIVRDGAYHWDVPPNMVYAMALGVAHGLAIHEHDADYSRNPTIFSREQSAKKPYLVIECSDRRRGVPSKPADLEIVERTDGVPQIALSAPANTLAYDVFVDDMPLARHNIPMADAGKRQFISLRDLPMTKEVARGLNVTIIARSHTGESSEPAIVRVPPSKQERSTVVTPVVTIPPESPSPVIGLDVISVMDKYDRDGRPVGELPQGYRRHNAIFDGERVRLAAAAGEVVGFQTLLRGQSSVTIDVRFRSPAMRVDISEMVYVPTNGRMIPDPLVPLSQSLSLSPDQDRGIIVDIYVPFDAKAGARLGELLVSDGRRLPIEVDVLPFALPRKATFSCEMNGYGLPDTVQQYETLQRIAYDHRVHANILHYSHHTASPGARKSNLDMRLHSGRRMNNARYDDVSPGSTSAFWDDFAEAFGPYLDGSLFADGHRGPIAAPGFYLTFHESWPLNCRAYFDGNLDAYQAFASTPLYAQTYVNVLRDFVELAKSKGWSQTGFQVYFNNKGSLNESSKAPWILDEPSSHWDYRALQYYGELTDQGQKNAATQPTIRIDYRIDISRPEFCRGHLGRRSDLWVVSSSAFQNYRRLVTDRIHEDGLRVWVYGTSNHVHQSNRNIEAWALDAWSHGATGMVPWQTVNKDGSAMKTADQLGLFIFDKDSKGESIIHHSMRLKAFRDTEQIIEYLHLLQSRRGWSLAQMRDFISNYVRLDADVVKVDVDDAGTSKYGELNAMELDSLRLAAIEMLLQ